MTQTPATPGQPAPNPSSASHDPVQVLADRFRAAIVAAYPQTARPDGSGPDPVIAVAKQQEFGDFQCNAAMALAKKVGENPRKVASAIVARVAPMVADIAEPLTEASIAGPGFINIRLRSDALGGLLASMDTPALGVAPAPQPERIVVDLCGVNLAKAMHVGHLRSTVIPDAIARTLTRLGHTVLRQSHLGDWGLNIAMVTGRIMRERAAGRLDLASVKLQDLEKLYKAAQAECERDMAGLEAVKKYGLGPKAQAELEEQVAGATEAFAAARKTLVDLQSREPETYKVWQRIYDVTMAACLETCRRLHADVTDEYTAGESTYADELGPLVEDLLARNIAEISDGAVVVRVEGVEVPCLIRKRDGGFLYATTDLAAIRRRVQKLDASRVIYGVDARQSLHFQQVFGAAKKAGYATVKSGPLAGNSARLEHAAFGTILGQDGRPFKTRSGESVSLTDLLDESVDRAKVAVAEREKRRERELSEAELARIAEVVGIAAIKYADLSNNRALDYVFDFDRMLASEGNTGPYLLYALVRVQSIFRTAEERGLMPAGGQAGLAKAALAIRAPAEKALALQLLRYPGVLQQVSDTLEPHRLCQYLYDLASAYSAFYDQCPVLAADNAEDRASRLRLCDLVGRVLADGLGVLGIPVLQRM